MDDLWRKLVSEASSLEAGLLAIYTGIGYLLGAWLTGLSSLPPGLAALDPTGWMFAFAVIAGGLTHLVAIHARTTRAATLAEKKSKDESQARAKQRTDLELQVGATLERMAGDIRAYGSGSQVVPELRPASAPKRGTFDDAPVASTSGESAQGGSASARARLRKSALSLETALEFFKEDDMDAAELEKVLAATKTERWAVREAFRSPAPRSIGPVEQDLGPILGGSVSEAVRDPFSN